MNALFGATGFVGGNLAAQRSFDCLYTSANALEAWGRDFDLVVCAAAPGEKWRANQEPRTDWQRLSFLIETLRHIKCRRFVLISTVDVYANPKSVNETAKITHQGLSGYGVNRACLEMYVQVLFPDALVLRLPALFGPSLKKNALFDLMRGSNQIGEIDPNAVYQWYPVIDLFDVIDGALEANLRLVNLVSDPISMREIAREFFPNVKLFASGKEPPHYNVETLYPEWRLSRKAVLGKMGEFLAVA